MQQQNTIKIEQNGSITLQDVNNSTVAINTSDAADIIAKLGSLNNAQLYALQQVAEKEVEKVGHRFKELLKGIASQKNIVGGNVEDVEEFYLGNVIARQGALGAIQKSDTSKIM